MKFRLSQSTAAGTLVLALATLSAGPLLASGLPAGAYFLDATSVELDGDGREDVAAATAPIGTTWPTAG